MCTTDSTDGEPDFRGHFGDNESEVLMRFAPPSPSPRRSARLRNGARVLIRPLRHADRAAVAAGFEHLSERSRYQRFLTGKGKLSEASLRALVDDVDQHRHVALALIWRRSLRPDQLIGVGRFVTTPEDRSTADVAVTVADEFHGQGAGTLLIRALAQRARDEGITHFTATMTTENEASHRMMRHAGAVQQDETADGLRTMAVAVGVLAQPGMPRTT